MRKNILHLGISRLAGHIESISNGCVKGWLADLTNLNEIIVFEAFADRHYLGTWTTGHPRADLRAAGYGNGDHGFVIHLGADYPPGLSLDEIQLFLPHNGSNWGRASRGRLEFDRLSEVKSSKRFREILASQPSIHREGVEDHIFTYLSGRSDIAPGDDFSRFVAHMRIKHQLSTTKNEIYSWLVHSYAPSLPIEVPLPLTPSEQGYLLDWLTNLGKKDVITYSFMHRIWSLFSKNNKYRVSNNNKYRELKREIIETRLLRIAKPPCDSHLNSKPDASNGWLQHVLSCSGGLKLEGLAANTYKIYNGLAKFDIGETRSDLDIENAKNEELSFSIRREKQNKADRRVQYVAPLSGQLGLGESARRMRSALVRSGLDFTQFDYNVRGDGVRGAFPARETLKKGCLNIIHLNLEEIPEFFLLNSTSLQESYTIVIPYLELDKPSPVHELGLSLVDEIWCASNYIKNALARYHARTIYVGVPARRITAPAQQVDAQGKQVDRERGRKIVFLTIFDAFSWPQRKNTLGAIRAFQSAFSAGENVSLVVKSKNAAALTNAAQIGEWQKLKSAASEDRRIILIDENFSRSEIDDLFLKCDCLVSLHRAEGLGLDMLDAIYNEIPVIATAYSGNMDYCNGKNSWLVDFYLRPVGLDEYAFVSEGHKWAEPCQISARSKFREAYDALCQGRERYPINSNMSEVANRIKTRLNEIMR